MRVFVASALLWMVASPAFGGSAGQDVGATGLVDFKQQVADGNVPGHAIVHKFGKAGDVDAAGGEIADIWDGATDTITGFTKTLLYTYSFTADIDRVSSSSASDTTDVEIQGLDANWDLTVQTLTLTGTTPVELTTDLIRVFRMKNVGDTAFAGDVFCFVNGATSTPGIPDTEADVRAIIQQGNDQTLMAIYTIPNGKEGFMHNFWASVAKPQTQISVLEMFIRKNPTGVFLLKHSTTLQSSGVGHLLHQFEFPLNDLPEKTDITFRASSSAANGAVSAGFELELIDQ